MKVKSISTSRFLSFRILLLCGIGGLSISSGEDTLPTKGEATAPTKVEDVRPTKAEQNENLPATIEDARGRARWMHEIIHGSLQVMHRDFFDEEGTTNLPSQSLDDVFSQMAKDWLVEVSWLGVNATKGTDHLPKNRFEEQAAEALKNGKKEYESVEGSRYRFAGAIRLSNQCLKCHVRDRKTLEDRVAGLVITFPMKTP